MNINCPHCKGILDVEEEHLGQKLQCHHCNGKFITPEEIPDELIIPPDAVKSDEKKAEETPAVPPKAESQAEKQDPDKEILVLPKSSVPITDSKSTGTPNPRAKQNYQPQIKTSEPVSTPPPAPGIASEQNSKVITPKKDNKSVTSVKSPYDNALPIAVKVVYAVFAVLLLITLILVYQVLSFKSKVPSSSSRSVVEKGS